MIYRTTIKIEPIDNDSRHIPPDPLVDLSLFSSDTSIHGLVIAAVAEGLKAWEF